MKFPQRKRLVIDRWFGDGSECHYVFHYLMSCSNHADNANDDDDDEVGPLCWLQSDANFPIKGL